MKLDDYIKENLFSEEFIPKKTPVRLQELPFGIDEIKEAIDSLISTFLVMGQKTKRFEKIWTNWIGRKESIFVNSGSSAVLLAMMWLKFKKAINDDRDEILIPAVTWSTSLFPAIIVGLKPILVDVDLDNLCVNSFSQYISNKTLAVMPVHLIGHACNMDRIMQEAEDHNIYVVEDCCEAHGTRYNGKKVGTFGDIGVWSFMFAHHITTIEGGMISVDSEDISDTMRMFRAHGWIREISEKKKKKIINENLNIHSSFLFPEIGLNVRPTEVNAAFGIHQMKRIDEFVDKRRAAFDKITEGLLPFSRYIQLFPEKEKEYFSPFAYPILINEDAPFSRNVMLDYLTDCNIHHRPIVGSNLASQPFMKLYAHLVEIRGELKNAEFIHNNGFFIGLNQDTNNERIEYIIKSFKEFFKKI